MVCTKLAALYGLLLLIDSNLVRCVPVETTPSLLLSSTGNTTLITPPEIVCDDHLGGANTLTTPDPNDCERAIARIPRDPRGQPVDRNFYIVNDDISSTLPNVATPLTKTVGTCTVQVLIRAEFWNVGHDTGSWIDIWGPARVMLQRCVRVQKLGGLSTENGRNKKIDVVIYDERSFYGLSRVIKYSRDPVAKSIALNELLDLIHLQHNPPPDPSASVLQLLSNAPNASIADLIARASAEY